MGKAGTFHFIGLLGLVALGHEDEPVPCAQLGQGFGYAREKLNLLLGDGAGEAFNALTLFVSHGRRAEPLEAVYQGACKARQAVAVREDGLPLNGVQRLAHIGGRVLVVIKVADECGDCALEVNIVLPQRIVGVNEQRLTSGKFRHKSYISELEWGGLRRRVRNA